MIWSLYLIVITIALMMLPLVPGLMELFRPTDLEPLRVPQGYDSNPMHFADGFRGFIAKHDFGDKSSKINRDGIIKEVGKYQVVGVKGIPTLSNNPTVDRLLLSTYDLMLPADKLFEKEVYTTANITTSNNGYFRTLLAGKDMQIGNGCMVIRWAHAEGNMTVGRKTTLLGRITSRSQITLGEGCSFERLYAPKIVFVEEEEPPVVAHSTERKVLKELDDVRL